MADVKVVMNHAGARSILTHPDVAVAIGSLADRVRDAANSMASEDDMLNEPFESDLKVGKNRARASVYTASPHGIRHNNKHNTLLKSVGTAGR